MARTIMDLFKEQKDDLYGLSATVLIETRGVVNPPRQAALLLASPNAVADLIGSAGAQIINGNANRPSDTIFKNNNVFTKPISVVPTVAQLRNAVEPDTPYFVKTEPSPGANIAQFIKNAVQSPAAAQTAVLRLLTQIGSKDAIKDTKNYYNSLKGIKRGINYGSTFTKDDKGKAQGINYFYSTHFPKYEETPNEYSRVKNKRKEYVKTGIVERKDFKGWDIINEQVLSAAAKVSDEEYTKALTDIDKDNKNIQQTFVKFSIYGKPSSKDIILPGTISGISEDFAPEWNSFKFIGSPFNLYKYGGVERTIKFNLKLYYLDDVTKKSMINNLNRLRKLVFPDEDISVATYPKQVGSSAAAVSQLFFTPNLVYLTINGLYENILGVVDSLGFSIEDNVAWTTTTNEIAGESEIKPYPNIINVSLGMKVIEHPSIENNKFMYDDSGKTTAYTNYFTNHAKPTA